MFFISNSRQPFHIVNMQSYINYKTSNLILTPTTKDNQTRKLILMSHSMRFLLTYFPKIQRRKVLSGITNVLMSNRLFSSVFGVGSEQIRGLHKD